MSHAVGDVERKNGHPVEDDGGAFMHACNCGKWGFFGYDVMLLKGRTGTWFCAEHRPRRCASPPHCGAFQKGR